MAVPSPFPTDKPALRKVMREKRRAMVGVPWSQDAMLFPLPTNSVVASYRPSGSEADPAALETELREGGATIAYPRLDQDAMRFYVPGPSGFVTGPHGIEAPGPDATAVTPTMILVPLLAFDRRGTRLGQGGGHYDRALAKLSAPKLGIAWALQEVPFLPRDPWDVPLDAIVTEDEWIIRE